MQNIKKRSNNNKCNVNNINTNNGKFKMKNMKKSTGYLIVILFWLVTTMILSSCGTWKWVEPMTPNSANNHRFNNSICR